MAWDQKDWETYDQVGDLADLDGCTPEDAECIARNAVAWDKGDA